jgi:hypothetical protein
MQLRNDQGTPIDPVPFLVTASMAFAVLYSFGPGYLLELGFSLPEALGVVTVLFLGTTIVAYHRLVRRARPEQRSEISASGQFAQLYYAILIGIVLLIVLLVVLVSVAGPP